MATIIPPELERFVEREVTSGKFRSREEVISEGLRLLQERERKLEALRSDIQSGLDQLERGEGTVIHDEGSRQMFAGSLFRFHMVTLAAAVPARLLAILYRICRAGCHRPNRSTRRTS